MNSFEPWYIQGGMGTHLENFLDAIKPVPLDLQRQITLMKELDGRAQDIHVEWAQASEDMLAMSQKPQVLTAASAAAGGTTTTTASSGSKSSGPLGKAYEQQCLQQLHLIRSKEIEELSIINEKIAIANMIEEYVRAFADRLENDIKVFEDELGPNVPEDPLGEMEHRKHYDRRDRDESEEEEEEEMEESDDAAQQDNYPGQQGGAAEQSGERYCICQQNSGGEMIGCDNDDCSIGWFHLECVGLKKAPEGQWHCDSCVREQMLQ